jgi:superfamily II DNA or RNA helicase
VCFEYGLQEALRDWWCCPPRARIVKCAGLNLSRVRVSGGDWSAADLDLVMGASRPLHELCLTTQRERVGSAIVYLPGVQSARAFAGLARSQYGMRADYVCGNTYLQPEEERSMIIEQFRRGEIDVLANCQIATMGFDAPIARTAILGRPTRSRVLWQQIVGRLTRPEPGCVDGPMQHMPGMMGVEARRTSILQSGKPYFKVVDITDETADHSIVTAVDMFAKEGTAAEAIARARKRAEDEECDPGDMLAQEAEALRKAQIIEAGLKAQQGQADGTLLGEDVCVQGRKKSIAEYRVPLRGRYSGRTMGELPDDYIQWALKQQNVRGWVRSYFSRERDRRRALS